MNVFIEIIVYFCQVFFLHFFLWPKTEWKIELVQIVIIQEFVVSKFKVLLKGSKTWLKFNIWYLGMYLFNIRGTIFDFLYSILINNRFLKISQSIFFFFGFAILLFLLIGTFCSSVGIIISLLSTNTLILYAFHF